MPILRHGRTGRLALVALGAASALLAAACGSSSGGGSGNSGNSGGASTTSANVTAAQQVVSQAMKRPTSITVTTPVGKPVPTGKKIVFISCGAAQCQLQG